MGTQEIVPQTAEVAEIPVSAPETQETQETTFSQEEVVAQQPQEAGFGEQNSVDEGSSPSKLKQDLINQRKKRQQAEREAAYLKGQLDAVQRMGTKPAVQTPPPPPVNLGPPVAPDLNKFETYDAYEKAKDEYLVNMAEYRIRQSALQQQQRQMQQQQALQQQHLRASFDQRIAEAAQADPTIVDIVNDTSLPISPVMGQVIQQSANAPQILKWLDNNRQVAAALSRMHPVRAAKELGELSAVLATAPAPAPPKRTSAAPPPIQTVKPSGGTVIDDADLPIDQYIARRNKQQFKR